MGLNYLRILPLQQYIDTKAIFVCLREKMVKGKLYLLQHVFFIEASLGFKILKQLQDVPCLPPVCQLTVPVYKVTSLEKIIQHFILVKANI